jgi:hypothetical protein
MKWLDEKGRVMGRIHWVDLILVIASLFIVGITIKSLWPTIPDSRYTLLRIEIAASDLPNRIVEGIQPGQWVKDAQSGIFFGKIVNKKVVQHTITRWEGEKLLRVLSPDTKDLYLVLEREGKVREREGIYVGRMQLRAGRKGVFHTLSTEFSGEVMAVMVNKPVSGSQ